MLTQKGVSQKEEPRQSLCLIALYNALLHQGSHSAQSRGFLWTSVLWISFLKLSLCMMEVSLLVGCPASHWAIVAGRVGSEDQQHLLGTRACSALGPWGWKGGAREHSGEINQDTMKSSKKKKDKDIKPGRLYRWKKSHLRFQRKPRQNLAIWCSHSPLCHKYTSGDASCGHGFLFHDHYIFSQRKKTPDYMTVSIDNTKKCLMVVL